MMYYTDSNSPVTGGSCWGDQLPQKIYPKDIDQLAPYPGYAGQGIYLLALNISSSYL